jgi:hypothetical protein
MEHWYSVRTEPNLRTTTSNTARPGESEIQHQAELDAKRNHLRHQLLVKWIKKQMSRIAENLSTLRHGSKKGLDHESGVEGTGRTKRKRTQVSPEASNTASSSGKRSLRKRARPDDTDNEARMLKRPRNEPSPLGQALPAPRRSVRITAKNAAAPPLPTEMSSLSSRRKARKSGKPPVRGKKH